MCCIFMANAFVVKCAYMTMGMNIVSTNYSTYKNAECYRYIYIFFSYIVVLLHTDTCMYIAVLLHCYETLKAFVMMAYFVYMYRYTTYKSIQYSFNVIFYCMMALFSIYDSFYLLFFWGLFWVLLLLVNCIVVASFSIYYFKFQAVTFSITVYVFGFYVLVFFSVL